MDMGDKLSINIHLVSILIIVLGALLGLAVTMRFFLHSG